MKVKNFFKQSVIMLLVALGIVSCTKTVDNSPEDIDSKGVIVPLCFSGEIVNAGTTPLSRAAGNDLLYIQVYAMEYDKYDDVNLVAYAHGLFDNTDNITVALKEGKEYAFIATMIKDGKNRVYKDEEACYGLPFEIQLTNKFVLSEYFDYYRIGSGSTQMLWGEYVVEYYRPDVDRYYGMASCIVNPEKIEPVNLNLMRTSFGLNVATENFNEGEIIVELEGAPTLQISAPNGSTSKIYTFSNLEYVYDRDCADDGTFTKSFTEEVRVSISRIYNGETIPVDSKYITFTRNMRTNIRVSVVSNMYENGFNVSYDSEEMTDDGQDIVFEGGGN